MTKEQKKIEEKSEGLDNINKEADEINNRINKLYGLSNEPINETKQYDPNELMDVRKKLIILLILLVIGGVVIFALLLNPFNTKVKDKNNDKDNIHEEKNEDNNEENYIGQISLDDDTVEKLNNWIDFSAEDAMKMDVFSLYNNDVTEIKNLSNDTKMFLLTKNDSFSNLLKDLQIEEYITTCAENGLLVSKENFDNLVISVFGDNILEYSNINYLYSSANLGEKKITLNFVNDNYILKCNEFSLNETIVKFVQQRAVKAMKTETGIDIYKQVVFINQSGVYKDPTFSTLITNDKYADKTDYISRGTTYKYVFNNKDNNYYLSKIEKVIEDSQ